MATLSKPLFVRTSDTLHAAVTSAAASSGMLMGEWVREVLAEAAARELSETKSRPGKQLTIAGADPDGTRTLFKDSAA